MSLAGFLTKHAGEVFSIASALTDVLDGLALRPEQASNVRATIDKLTKASESITKSIPAVEKATVKISKADIEKAVAAVVGPLVEKAVADALAKRDADAKKIIFDCQELFSEQNGKSPHSDEKLF